MLLLLACAETPTPPPPPVRIGVRVVRNAACPAKDRILTGAPPPLSEWCREDGEPAGDTEAEHLVLGVQAMTDDIAAADAANTLSAVGRFRGAGGTARVAVLDTSPTAGPGRDPTTGRTPFDTNTTSPHGSTLANLAGELLCEAWPDVPPEGCAAEVTTRLALPYRELVRTERGYSVTEDRERGGAFGSPATLAEAVWGETQSWLAAHPDGTGLVLNISAGFEPRWADSGAGLAEEVEVLRAAVTFARCSGALVVAAEGNVERPEQRDAFETLLPAAWGTLPRRGETRTAPVVNPPSCARLGFGRTVGRLVVPVGSLNAAGELPAFAPTKELTALRAYGMHASATVASMARRGDEAPWAVPIRGSSVSSLIVATAAAARWSAGKDACDAPATTPLPTTFEADDVVAQLEAGCVRRGPPVSFGPSNLAETVRVRAAEAVGDCSLRPNTICSESAGSLPEGLAQKATVAKPPASSLTSCSPAQESAPTCADPAPIAQWCGSGGGCLERVTTPLACPEADPGGASVRPWVLTQPPPPYCPFCFWDPNGKILYVHEPPVPPNPGTAGAVLALKVQGDPKEHIYGGLIVSATGEQWFHLDIQENNVEAGRLIVFANGTEQSAAVRIGAP